MDSIGSQLVRIVQRRTRNAAQDTRAFEVGTIAAVEANGTLQVDIPGVGTLRQVGRLAGRSPSRVGTQVLNIRVGGDLQMSVGAARAPYIGGQGRTVDR